MDPRVSAAVWARQGGTLLPERVDMPGVVTVVCDMGIELILQIRNFAHEPITRILEPLWFVPHEVFDLLCPVPPQIQSLGFQLFPVRFPRLGISGAQVTYLLVSLVGGLAGQASGQVCLGLAELFFVFPLPVGEARLFGLSLLFHLLL